MRGLDQRTAKEIQIDDLRAAAAFERQRADKHEAKALEYDARADVIEERNVIQIRFPGRTRKSYAYRVPEGLSVEVGDFVKVTAYNSWTVEDAATLVEVVGRGRQGYTGPIRDIDGKVQILTEDA